MVGGIRTPCSQNGSGQARGWPAPIRMALITQGVFNGIEAELDHHCRTPRAANWGRSAASWGKAMKSGGKPAPTTQRVQIDTAPNFADAPKMTSLGSRRELVKLPSNAADSCAATSFANATTCLAESQIWDRPSQGSQTNRGYARVSFANRIPRCRGSKRKGRRGHPHPSTKRGGTSSTLEQNQATSKQPSERGRVVERARTYTTP